MADLRPREQARSQGRRGEVQQGLSGPHALQHRAGHVERASLKARHGDRVLHPVVQHPEDPRREVPKLSATSCRTSLR